MVSYPNVLHAHAVQTARRALGLTVQLAARRSCASLPWVTLLPSGYPLGVKRI